MLSVIIPSRKERWLQQTVDDLLSRARGEVEIICVLDGAWQELKNDKRVKIFHHGTDQGTPGMRESINAGMSLAKGDYVMKIDGHCTVGEGYDLKLIKDCQDDWVVVPRRYRLDVDKWEVIEDGRPPVDYMFVDYPYYKPFDQTQGLHGAEWREKYHERKDVPIDDLMTFQGSCYFMSKKHWEWLGDLDTKLYGPFTHESQEISFKTWLGGGRCVVNKNTWYAHLHKGKKHGTGYGFNNKQWEQFAENKERGRQACIDYWLNNKWKERKYDFEWMIERFMPMPHWPDDWKEQIFKDQTRDWSKLGEDTWRAKRY